MVFKPKKKAEEFEEEELDESQESDDLEEVDEDEARDIVREAKKDKKQITVNDVLVNHENRLKEIEALLYRLKNI